LAASFIILKTQARCPLLAKGANVCGAGGL
jgi:hypothetical protein